MKHYPAGMSLAVAAALICAAAVEAELGSFTYTHAGVTITYGLYTPEHAVPSDGFPLVLALHGASECGSDLRHLYANEIDSWFAPHTQSSYPCYVLLPQCPSNDYWVNVPSWWRTGYSIDSIPQSQSLGAVAALLDSLLDVLAVDTARVYVTGLSMGGYGTWDMVLRYPRRFAAAVPVCGAGDPENACRVAHLPVWVCHSNDDDIVPVDGSRAMVTALRSCGRPAVYTHCSSDGCHRMDSDSLAAAIDAGAALLYSEYDGYGHFAWVPAYGDTLLRRWLFAQARGDNVAAKGMSVAAASRQPSAVPGISVDLCGRLCPLAGPPAKAGAFLRQTAVRIRHSGMRNAE